MSVLRFRRGPHSQRQKVPPAAAIIDEFTRERLAIRIDRKLRSTDVIDALSDLFILRGVPGHFRSDNGPEFVAKIVRQWIAAVGSKDHIHRARQPPGERVLRELQLEAPTTPSERRVVLQSRRGADLPRELATALQYPRPHSSLGYKPPAPAAVLWPGAPATSTVAAKAAMHWI